MLTLYAFRHLIDKRHVPVGNDGPLALAVDYMVFNITKDDIRVRMAAVDEDIWPMPSALGNVPPDPALQRTEFSQMMLDGRVVHRDILEEIYGEIEGVLAYA